MTGPTADGIAPASTVDGTLVCGCPFQWDPEHRDGCWMGQAEQVAIDGYLAAESGGELIGTLTALAAAGYLRVPDSQGELLSLLDALAEAELLGPCRSAEAA